MNKKNTIIDILTDTKAKMVAAYMLTLPIEKQKKMVEEILSMEE